ncbi:imidazolonepropionase [Seinonella peptonophila]|uniref:Imidazolonepropionase n=1 Tax=Seinonella peptonophila TaxID=112248 RepID=A0A1M4W927_9BACL|nr:imidazolonepropionase [Seinonella peptonophila]SHE77482.1 imidazolonepropionase [Seinonella peptonophila]
MKTIDRLIYEIGKLYTLRGPARPRSGSEMQEVSVIENAAIAIAQGQIVAVGKEEEVRQQLKDTTIVEELNAKGRIVTPGFVDPHTHLVHGGSREHELSLKLQGVSYLDILAQGGGILSTVRSTRQATEEELYRQAKKSLDRMLILGATTVEAKSGYGLTLTNELKQLRVAKMLNERHPIELVSTFMGAHAIPEEYKGDSEAFVQIVIEEMLPEVKARGLAEFCDVFCEKGVFTVEESRRILTAAQKLGFGLKIHADEIESLGGAELAGELNCISAEHLLAASDKGLQAMADHGVIAVCLPATSFNLGVSPARVRRMIELNLAVALSTDYNPGSSPTESPQMVMTLGCLQLKMTPEEVLTAMTINAAYAINRGKQVGSIEIGKQADLVIFDTTNLAYIPYHFGINHVDTVLKKGDIVVQRGQLLGNR